MPCSCPRSRLAGWLPEAPPPVSGRNQTLWWHLPAVPLPSPSARPGSRPAAKKVCTALGLAPSPWPFLCLRVPWPAASARSRSSWPPWALDLRPAWGSALAAASPQCPGCEERGRACRAGTAARSTGGHAGVACCVLTGRAGASPGPLAVSTVTLARSRGSQGGLGSLLTLQLSGCSDVADLCP